MEQPEHDFDKGLRNILENPPPIPPNEASLFAMYERLEADPIPGFWRLWTWSKVFWVAIATLPILLGFIFFYQQLRQAQHQIDELELLLSQRVSFVDTTIHQKTIYRYDTLVEVAYVQKRVISNSFKPKFSNSISQSHLPFAQTPSTDISQFSKFPQRTRLWPAKDISPTYTASVAEQDSVQKKLPLPQPPSLNSQSVINALSYLRPNLLDWLTVPDSATSFVELPQNIPIKKGFQLSIIPLIVSPTGHYMGLNLTPMSYLSQQGRMGFGGGFVTGLQFRDRIQVEMGAEVLRWKYEEQNGEVLAQYPIAAPINSEDILKELYVTLNFLEFSGGTNYIFRPEKKLRPFLGAGVIFRKALTKDFRAEYIGSFQTYRRDSTLGASPLDFAGVRLSTGVYLPFAKRWNLKSIISYSYDLNGLPENIIDLNRWSIRLGVNYQFN